MKDSNNTLILYNSVPFFLKYFNRENIYGSWIHREIPFFLKVIRKITRVLKLSQVIWFADWKDKLSSINTVIIFAPLRETEVLSFIKKRNPRIRVIYWYWNPVFRIGHAPENIQEHAELWSFDPLDCSKYSMKYNTTFYFKDIKISEKRCEFDCLFVGNDKGRGRYLLDLEERLTSVGLKNNFHIIPDRKTAAKSEKKRIPYNEYLILISKTKAIIDINPDGQSGPTLRPMEALFFKKKLITSDLSVMNHDFYDKRNIFILEVDDFTELRNFIDSPYFPLSNSIIERYDVGEWIQRFN